MRPCVSSKSSEVLVETPAIRNVKPAAFKEPIGLHLPDQPVVGVGPYGVSRLRRWCIDIHRAELVDTARLVHTDYPCRLLSKLTFDRKPILHLVGNCGIRGEPGEVRRLFGDGDAIRNGYAAGGGQ